jgi:pimeloyl-ACP methyl ester carboxylesterase
VVLLATPGVPGADLVLQQQQHALGKLNISDAEKQARIAMQRRINEAAITGKGLDQFTADIRRQIDNPAFQSALGADPGKFVARVRQPMLVVQGELDTQVAPSNADRLVAIAQARKPTASVDVVKLPAVNHLLAMAVTGEPDEYDKLPAKHVSADVSTAVVDWLKKTLK